MSWSKIGPLLWQGTIDTLIMTLPSTFLAYLIGMPLGILMVVTRKDHILPRPLLNTILGAVINLLRSIPFIILLVMLYPVTRAVMGMAIGTIPFIFPLTVGAFSFVARMVEASLLEVDPNVIEAANSMGSSTWQIISKVLIPESIPSLVNGFAISITAILAYTAMAGTAGGNGLGKIAIAYGLNQRQFLLMYLASIILVILVMIFQVVGNALTRALDHRRR